MARARISRTGPTPGSSSSDDALCSTISSRHRLLTRRTLQHSRKLEMMIGSKSCGPSGGFRAPSPRRRRPTLRPFPSPHPNPLPQGEGDRWQSAGKFECCICTPRFFVFRFGGTRQPISVVLPNHGRMVLPLLGERVGVRGNEANSNPRRTTTLGIVKLHDSPVVVQLGGATRPP
jgi:hypothetical protein